MARHNLVIKLDSEPFYFHVDESALDYFQQTGKYLRKLIVNLFCIYYEKCIEVDKPGLSRPKALFLYK